jgi:branched-chain amino acid transport system ATP-binding protein
MLRIQDLHAGYGATPILFGVSLEVKQGEAVALLGKNGMGKTTLMKAAMGFIKPTRGSIDFEGSELTRLTPHEIARRGIGFVPENRRIFPGLTVRENLELGLSAVAHRTAALRRERFEEVFRHFPRLGERIEQPAKTMSGGEQQMLAIARVLRTGADIFLLDEPTEGLAPVIVEQICTVIDGMKKKGHTVLLVEQNFHVAALIADRHYVMEHGRIVDVIARSELTGKLDRIRSLLGI